MMSIGPLDSHCGSSGVRQVVVVSALRLTGSKVDRIARVDVNGPALGWFARYRHDHQSFDYPSNLSTDSLVESFKQVPLLSDVACLNDELLALLIQALRIEAVPATVLVTPGYRATAWSDDSMDVSRVGGLGYVAIHLHPIHT